LAEWRSPKPQVGGSIPSWPAKIKKDRYMSKTTSKTTAQNSLLWLAIVGVTIAALCATYGYHFSLPVQTIIWIVWLVIALGIGYFTVQGQAVYVFAEDAWLELQKVTWPERQETVRITMIVVSMVGLTGMILWGVDNLMMWFIAKVTHLG